MKNFFTLSATSLILLGNLLFAETGLANEFTTPESKFALIKNLECRKINNNYVTVAISNRNNINTATYFIVWQTWEFSSSGYTPQRRCREATSKLKRIIADNGASLSGLLLSTGRVDRYRVLCHSDRVNLECSDDNFLFHISGNNRKNPYQLMSKLLNFSVIGSISPIIE